MYIYVLFLRTVGIPVEFSEVRGLFGITQKSQGLVQLCSEVLTPSRLLACATWPPPPAGQLIPECDGPGKLHAVPRWHQHQRHRQPGVQPLLPRLLCPLCRCALPAACLLPLPPCLSSLPPPSVCLRLSPASGLHMSCHFCCCSLVANTVPSVVVAATAASACVPAPPGAYVNTTGATGYTLW